MQVFGTFLGPWEFVNKWMAYKNAEVEASYLEEAISPLVAPEFRPGSEANVVVTEYSRRVRRLQASLPTGCMLTNNGTLPGHGLCGDWGTPKDDDTPGWHIFNVNSYKQMIGENGAARSPSGEPIHKGLVQTVYLQCGPPEENALDGKTLRFYPSAADWFVANPRAQANQRRFEGGLGSAAVGSPSGAGPHAPSCSSA